MKLNWSPYPPLPILSDEEIVRVGPQKSFEYYTQREEAIRLAELDPLHYGLEFPSWKHADEMLSEYDELMCFGGNGSAKSRYGARTVVKAALENRNCTIVCFAQDEDASVRIQQKYVYEYLPPHLKENIKTKSAYVKYSEKNGFTRAEALFPNGSKLFFHTYAQYLANPKKFEGYEYGTRQATWINLGLWFDEYLGDGSMIQTIRIRAARRNASMLFTFTPIDGLTHFVDQYYRNAETLQYRDVDKELLPEKAAPSRVPYQQVNRSRNAGIIYFHTDQNPWGGYERLKKDLLNEPLSFRVTRAYGVPTANFTSLFPKFSNDVHVIPQEKLPDFNATSKSGERLYTLYQVIDPAEGKNWFMIWVAVNSAGVHYVYREWPDYETHGEWSKWGKQKWVPGDAAKGLGMGFKEYAELMRELEGTNRIFDRILDSRLGFSPKMGNDESSSIDYGLSEHEIECIPSSGINEAQGIQRINDLLSYDTSRTVDALNMPRLFIADCCQNTIKAFASYNSEGRIDEAWKDPVDCVRYMATADFVHITDAELQQKSTKKGGY